MQTRRAFGQALAVASLAAGAGLAVSATPANAVEDGRLGPPVPEGVDLVVTADRSGDVISVTTEQRFAVALVGVPTAGYQWTPWSMPSFLTRAGEASGPTLEAQNEPDYAGGQHWEVFCFAALQAGEGELVLVQRRPWETSEPPVDVFRIRVRAA